MRRIPDVLRRSLGNGAAPALLLATALMLYLEHFIPPFTHILSWSDQSVYAGNARRMLEGQIIYKDFFQFTTPGTELLDFTVFKLLGPQGWIPSVMGIAAGVVFAWLQLRAARTVLKPRDALLASAMLVTLCFRSFLGGTHHSYSSVAVIAAIACGLRSRTLARVAITGALCGLAACFTQVAGMCVVGFAAYLLWEQVHEGWPWRRLLKLQGCLFAGFLGTLLVFNAYFAWRAGVGRFLFCTVVFGARYYTAVRQVNSVQSYLAWPPELGSWLDVPRLAIYLFVHALLPFVYVLFIVRYFRMKRSLVDQPWSQLMLLNFVGIALSLGVAPAPSYTRLATVAWPGLILFLWLLRSYGGYLSRATILIWIVCLGLAVFGPLRVQRHWRAYLDLQSGRAALIDPDWYDRCKWVFDHTHPSDYFFDGSGGVFYFDLQLENPAPLPFITPTDYTRPEQVEQTIEGLKSHAVRFVLWPAWLDSPDPRFPAHDHLGPLRSYVQAHYHIVKVFPAYDYDAVWEKNP